MSNNRTGLSFGKKVTRAARAAHGSSLCPKCKVEHGSQKDHTMPVDMFHNAPSLAMQFFRDIGMACDTIEELRECMKSDANLGLLCTRCHFEKSRAENDAGSVEEKYLIALRWYGVSFNENHARRTTRKTTRDNARTVAPSIARDTRTMEYHAERGNHDEVRRIAKRRAAKRRDARGIV